MYSRPQKYNNEAVSNVTTIQNREFFMFRRYAIFTNNNPLLHNINLMIVILVMLVSVYQLIENEQLVYANGIAFALLSVLMFARAADYKRKYLTKNK